MSQKRLNNLAILSTYQTLVDNMSLIAVANVFVENKSNRHGQFGKLQVDDLQFFGIIQLTDFSLLSEIQYLYDFTISFSYAFDLRIPYMYSFSTRK